MQRTESWGSEGLRFDCGSLLSMKTPLLNVWDDDLSEKLKINKKIKIKNVI